jgi:hypothetical protein
VAGKETSISVVTDKAVRTIGTPISLKHAYMTINIYETVRNSNGDAQIHRPSIEQNIAL